MRRTYVCAECGEAARREGTGLGTWTCPKHPRRFVAVTRDFSAGKEADRNSREVAVTVTRHTKVKVEV